jgi:hypothetical protein
MHAIHFAREGPLSAVGIASLQFSSLQLGGGRLLRGAEIRGRETRQQGEYVGSTYFRLNFNVEPADDVFFAEAYECDIFNDRVDRNQPLLTNESMRVCVRPDKVARERGVYMYGIEEFSFSRGKTSQAVVELDGSAANDGRTLLLCSQGEDVCSFKTELLERFFVDDGNVRGQGDVIMQFGSSSDARRLVEGGGRRAQIIQSGLYGPGYAGAARVALNFDVAFSKAARTKPTNWWGSSTVFLRVLYVTAIITSVTIVFYGLSGLFFLYRKRKLDVVVDDEFDVSAPNNRELDLSVDAFHDSKASFYSDLEFRTDSEVSSNGMSSDEESSWEGDAVSEDNVPTHPDEDGWLYTEEKVNVEADSELCSLDEEVTFTSEETRDMNLIRMSGPPDVNSLPSNSTHSQQRPAPPQNGENKQKRPPPVRQNQPPRPPNRPPPGKRNIPGLTNIPRPLRDDESNPGSFGIEKSKPAKNGKETAKTKAARSRTETPPNAESKDKADKVASTGEETQKSDLNGTKKTQKKSKRNKKRVADSSADAGKPEDDKSVPVTITTDDKGDADLEEVPEDEDVCFDADEHPGTVAFIKAVHTSIEQFADEDYSPEVYRVIKRQLKGRRFFVCDDDTTNSVVWREAEKSEIIDCFWNYFESEKEKLCGR